MQMVLRLMCQYPPSDFASANTFRGGLECLPVALNGLDHEHFATAHQLYSSVARVSFQTLLEVHLGYPLVAWTPTLMRPSILRLDGYLKTLLRQYSRWIFRRLNSEPGTTSRAG